MTGQALTFRWLTAPAMVEPSTRDELVACWRDVSNAGGAVGFPFLPVDDEHVRPVVDALVASLDPTLNRLLVATVGETMAGWLVLAGNERRVARHWATVLRVQTSLAHRGTGVGRAMMTEVARAACDDLGLEQLHLELRSGVGLESFYESSGWRVIGAWPAALRIGDRDYRDEVLMVLELR